MYFHTPAPAGSLPRFISVGIGIALCPDDGMSYEELFTAADRAVCTKLYRTENAGSVCQDVA